MAIRTQYEQGQFCWISLEARDLDEARRFYRELFGWQSQDVELPDGPRAAEFTLDGRRVAGASQMPQQRVDRDQPAVWRSYIRVDDLESTCARVTELGGEITLSATDVQQLGRTALVRDPTGAEVGLWQAGTQQGAELMQDFHCCCWNELLTRDIEKAREFYGALFGWEFADYPSSETPYYVVSQHGEETSGLLQMDQRWGEMPARWMVYFAVHSVDLSVDYVRQLNGFVQIHPYDIPEGRFAMVSDAQGAAFDLVEMNQLEEASVEESE